MGNCFTNQCSPKPSSVVPVNQVSKVTQWRQLKNCVFQDKRTRGRVPGVVQLGENSAVTIRAITESRGREGSEHLKERRSTVPEKADSKVVRGCLFCFGFVGPLPRLQGSQSGTSVCKTICPLLLQKRSSKTNVAPSDFLTQTSWRLYEIRQPPTSIQIRPLTLFKQVIRGWVGRYQTTTTTPGGEPQTRQTGQIQLTSRLDGCCFCLFIFMSFLLKWQSPFIFSQSQFNFICLSFPSSSYFMGDFEMPAKLIQFNRWYGIQMIIKVIGLPRAPSVPISNMGQKSEPK